MTTIVPNTTNNTQTQQQQPAQLSSQSNNNGVDSQHQQQQQQNNLLLNNMKNLTITNPPANLLRGITPPIPPGSAAAGSTQPSFVPPINYFATQNLASFNPLAKPPQLTSTPLTSATQPFNTLNPLLRPPSSYNPLRQPTPIVPPLTTATNDQQRPPPLSQLPPPNLASLMSTTQIPTPIKPSGLSTPSLLSDNNLLKTTTNQFQINHQQQQQQQQPVTTQSNENHHNTTNDQVNNITSTTTTITKEQTQIDTSSNDNQNQINHEQQSLSIDNSSNTNKINQISPNSISSDSSSYLNSSNNNTNESQLSNDKPPTTQFNYQQYQQQPQQQQQQQQQTSSSTITTTANSALFTPIQPSQQPQQQQQQQPFGVPPPQQQQQSYTPQQMPPNTQSIYRPPVPSTSQQQNLFNQISQPSMPQSQQLYRPTNPTPPPSQQPLSFSTTQPFYRPLTSQTPPPQQQQQPFSLPQPTTFSPTPPPLQQQPFSVPPPAPTGNPPPTTFNQNQPIPTYNSSTQQSQFGAPPPLPTTSTNQPPPSNFGTLPPPPTMGANQQPQYRPPLGANQQPQYGPPLGANQYRGITPQQPPTGPPLSQPPIMQPTSTLGPPPMSSQSPVSSQPKSIITTNRYPTVNATNQMSPTPPPMQSAQRYPQPTTTTNNQYMSQPSPQITPPKVPPTTGQSNMPSSQTLTNNQYLVNNSNSKSKSHVVDLLNEKRLIKPYEDNFESIRPHFPHEFYTNVNCHPDIIRSTLTLIPESQTLLGKCRLPLGILIHPFKDLESLKVVQSATIVRCRNCRSYINPFVHFLDNTKWRCNLCYSVNDLPDEFLFDPVTRSYGDPSKRPEINSSTIEFIAPVEYTLRPPPPAMYLFLMDVSHNAVNTGYLQNACEILLECLDKLPGDGRTQIGFITYNSCLHFYNLSDSLSQPQMMIYPDIDEVLLPIPDGLMVNLAENRETIQTFLEELPHMFKDTYETDSALGPALNAAFKLLNSTGGRITVMQTILPNVGIGSLKQRNESIEKDTHSLGPQTDFYKKLALDCAGVHIAVDLFMFNALYADVATLSCISKYSGGEIKYYREFHMEHFPEQADRFCYDFKRYLTRKIGFEAVMRVRCTRGLSIHTFHGNFFVRSTDLLALPNVNPDSGFGMQVSIDETLTDTPTVCFQAALLYTSSKGERRIRIHTYCLPVTNNLSDLMNSADQEAVVGLVCKMAVDRSIASSIKEAKDALVNVAVDYLSAFTHVMTSHQKGGNSLLTLYSLRLLPLYVLALLKSSAFKSGNVKVDDRSYMMNVYKTMPLKYLLLYIHPHLYPVHNLDNTKTIVDSDTEICLPPQLHLSSESIDRHGVYILDACENIYMWVGRSVNDQFLQQVFNVKSYHELPDHSSELPELENPISERIRNFIVYLYDQRPFGASFMFFREDSPKSHLFFQHIHEDKTDSSLSYQEFIRYVREQVNSS